MNYRCAQSSRKTSKYVTRRQANVAVHIHNKPDDSEIHNAPIDLHFVVYRIEKRWWENSFSIFNIDSEHSTLLCLNPAGPSKFWAIVVKHYFLEVKPHMDDRK